jgi:hypothetical protein
MSIKCGLSQAKPAASYKYEPQYVWENSSYKLHYDMYIITDGNIQYYCYCMVIGFLRGIHNYTGCPRRNVQYFGRVFLMLNYTKKTQNTYIQSWTVTEIMAREDWNFDSCYTLIDYQIHIKTGKNMWFE